MKTIRAISLWEPWATAIAMGLKSFETRHWAPKMQLGSVLAIHAAKRTPTITEMNFARVSGIADQLSPGHLVCICRIKAIHRTDQIADSVTVQELSWGNYGPGRFAWELSLICRLKDPIPTKGYQAFFSVQVPDFEEAK